jgi:hypothetical protein
MPIDNSWKHFLDSLKEQKDYQTGENVCRDMKDGSKFCMHEKGWSVFFATINKKGWDETKPSSNLEYSIDNQDVEAITPRVFAGPQTGLYLTEPHGKLIYDGSKTLIVKHKKFEAHLNEDLYLLSDSLCYGTIVLKEPYEIKTKEEFDSLRSKHKISNEEVKDWKWEFPLYGYEFTFTKLDKPQPVKVPQGVQVFVSSSNLKFENPREMSNEELEYFHTLSHVHNLEYADPWCRLHSDIVEEMLDRNLDHFGLRPCDRPFELIKSWKTYDPSKIPDKVLLDDHRITIAWLKTLESTRKPFESRQFKGMTLEEQLKVIKKLAEDIVEEMKKRGWHPKELVDLPHNFNVEDIDVPFVNNLSDKDLEELWVWLHKKWLDQEGPDRVTEGFLNANVFIQTERWKRGIIDTDYKDKDKLDSESRMTWQEYGIPSNPLEMEIEKGEITLEEALQGFQEVGNIIVKGYPFASYLTGRIVNEGKIPKGHDIDLAIRQDPDPRLIEALIKIKPTWLAKRLHPFFDKGAAGIGYSVPIHGYSLNPLPKEFMKRGFNPYSLEEVKVGRYIIGLKPMSGFGKNEFWDPQELWTKWASSFIDKGIVVQEKVDGRRIQCHKEGDNVKLITEDTQRDRAKEFPEIVDEIKKLKEKDLILDGEFLAYDFQGKEVKGSARRKRELGDLMPREDTAVITVGTPSDDFRKLLVYVIYDIMYLPSDPNITSKGYSERYKQILNVIPSNLQFIDPVRGEIASNMKDFFRLVQKYRSLNGSEGVVCKDPTSPYPIKYSGENRTREWAKLKNLKEIEVIVLDAIQKKTVAGKALSTWIYVCGYLLPENEVSKFSPSRVKEYNGKHYQIIGKAYGTSQKVSVGSIVTIMPIRIRQYEEKGGIYYTWMFPFFKEEKKEKHEADTLTTVERLAKIGTGPPTKALEDDLSREEVVTILLDKCKYWNDEDICPLKKRFLRPIHLSKVRVEEEILRFPVMCPLAKYYKCRYIKDYYYKITPVDKYSSSLSDFIDIVSLPNYPRIIMLQKYMESPKGEHDFVMQGHFIGDSEHMDWRMKVDGYLVGWSIVGANRENPHTPDTLIKNPGQGFRAEEKARQPLEWIHVHGELKPGTVGGGVEAGGEMKIWTSGKVIWGSQKSYYHEYFLKDPKYFKDWTRIIVRLLQVQKIEPTTKEKGKHKEEMWRIMLPVNQCPYAIDKRARQENWKPPKSNPVPFPEEWAREKFPKDYEKWKEYMGSKSLSNIKYTFSQHSYKGPVHVRGSWRNTWYLFLDDKGTGSVRVFSTDSFPVMEGEVAMFDEGRESRKYMDLEGKTRPNSRFNPNRSLVGEMKILSKGSVDMEDMKDVEVEGYSLKFPSGILKGNWGLIQEEKGSDTFTFEKAGLSLGGENAKFVYQKHIIGDRFHYDIRYQKEGSNIIEEFNLYSDIRSEPARAVKKTCDDPSWMHIDHREMKMVGPLQTYVEPIDKGDMLVIEENPDFISYELKGNELKGLYIAKREDGGWVFSKSHIARPLSGGDPNSGPFKDFLIEEKKGWPYFNMFLFDIREFTRTESPSKAKVYLPGLDVPSGVTIYIGLYPRIGKIHGARVALVQFDKEKWDYKKAEEWTRKNNLQNWNGELIRA